MPSFKSPEANREYMRLYMRVARLRVKVARTRRLVLARAAFMDREAEIQRIKRERGDLTEMTT